MRKRIRYYIYFFVAALFLQLIALLKIVMDPPAEIELRLYNESYTLNEVAVIQTGAIFYFVLGTGYWIFRRLRRKLNYTLCAIHTLITVGGLTFYALSLLANGIIAGSDDEISANYNETVIMLLLPLIIIAQALYAANVFIGINSRSNRHRHRKKEY